MDRFKRVLLAPVVLPWQLCRRYVVTVRIGWEVTPHFTGFLIILPVVLVLWVIVLSNVLTASIRGVWLHIAATAGLAAAILWLVLIGLYFVL